MPGIVGIIGKGSHKGDASTLRRMMECMMHEPFYTSGTYVNERLGLCVGWVNRAESFSDCLPIWNEANNVCLIFSGENYTDRSETDQLRAKGHQFDPENASYLVHLYEENGLKFFERLNGRFSGVLVDLRKHSAILFNDRYGSDRLYYHEKAGGIYFSSEAKSLLKVLPALRQLDPIGLAETFSSGCVLQNRTLFKGISLLPGGSAWTFISDQHVKKEKYFRQEVWESQVALSSSEYYEKLKETWERILPRYFQGKERVAVSLTGGKDSRMIMAWAQHAPETLPCYTFGGMFRDCEDVKLARLVAGICKQPHQVISVNREFLSQFPTLAEKTVYITDGAMDVSGAPDLFVNGIARQIAPVRLTGNYGQEVLRSAIAFKPNSLHRDLFEHEFVEHIRTAAKTYAGEFNENRRTFVAFKQLPWHHYSRLALEQSQLTLRSPYLDNDLVALAFRTPPELAESIEPQLRLIDAGNTEVGKIGTDRGVLYRSVPVGTKLKHLYQEFTFKAEYAYDYGMPQWLAGIDHIFSSMHFERLFLGRHKFFHFRIWYRDELSGYIKDILLDSRTRARPYLNGKNLEKMVLDHTAGRGNYTSEIHRVLTSELIQRTLIEKL